MSAQGFLSSLSLKKKNGAGSTSSRLRLKGSRGPLFGRRRRRKKRKSRPLAPPENPTLHPEAPPSTVPNSFDPFPDTVPTTVPNSVPHVPYSSMLAELDRWDSDELHFPVASVEPVQAHDGAITALSLNPIGSRMVTGSADHSLRLWDFHATPYPMEVFREPVDEEGGPLMGEHPINEICWRPHCGANRFLAVANTCKMKIFDRDCKYLAETVRGDMYLRDKNRVKGHVGAVFDARWHPVLENAFASGSIDGTLRLWDAPHCHRSSFRSFKTLGYNKRYIPCTSLEWGKENGSLVVCSLLNGSLVMFDVNAPSGDPVWKIPEAHTKGQHVTRIRIGWASDDGKGLLWARCVDGSVKIWDLRQLDKLLETITELPCRHMQTDFEFSPDGKYVLTGVSEFQHPGGERGERFRGGIAVIDRKELQLAAFEPFPSPVIRIDWNSELDQVFCGCCDNVVRVFYETDRSKKGILFPLARKARVAHIESLQEPDEIYLPHALRMYQKKDSRGTQWAKNRRNPQRSFMPTAPGTAAVGVGGELGTSQQEHLLKEMGIGADDSWREDPRAALFRANELAKTTPLYVATAYQDDTQAATGRKRSRDADIHDEDEPANKRQKTE